MKNRRGSRGATLLAFLVAPLATIPVAAILVASGWLLGLGPFGGAPVVAVLSSVFMLSVFAVPSAYTAAVVLGIPAYAMARRLGLLGLGHSLVIGASVALLPLWLYFAFVAAVEGLRVTRDVGTALAWTVLFAACGMSAGAAFWGIALRPRAPGSPGD